MKPLDDFIEKYNEGIRLLKIADTPEALAGAEAMRMVVELAEAVKESLRVL